MALKETKTKDMAEKPETLKIKYVGPKLNIMLANGIAMKKGEAVEVDATIADRLVAVRPHHFEKVA